LAPGSLGLFNSIGQKEPEMHTQATHCMAGLLNKPTEFKHSVHHAKRPRRSEGTGAIAPGSVQSKLSNVPRVGFQLPALDALDEVGQHGIGAAGQADFLALPHH
jgi:hypothetical protein